MMDTAKMTLLLALLFIFPLACVSQNMSPPDAQLVGAPCEGCKAVFEFGAKDLNPVDTLPDFDNPGPKLKVTGTIYEPDGKTPAENVVLYIYHTNQEGIYATRGDETGWGRRHGYIRGWIKTNTDGRYTFYTLKPGTYPSRSEPAHIHPVLLEPNGKYYWLGSYFFDGDPLLTEEIKRDTRQSARGGSSGVIKLRKQGGLLIAERDFILGRNIPAYQ